MIKNQNSFQERFQSKKTNLNKNNQQQAKPEDNINNEPQNNQNENLNNVDDNIKSQQSEDSQEAQKIQELEAEIVNLNEKNLRLLAEIDNLRRRSKEDIEKTAKYAISNFVNDLVVSVENFFLANSHAPRDEIEKIESLKNYAQAIDMTQKEIMKILEKYNVKRIYPIEQKFDHNYHEALSQIESDKEDGTVVQVIQAGYSIGDRLIKPALVCVSKKKTN